MYCKDCEQEFDEAEVVMVGEVDYIDVCPFCGSVNLRKEKENARQK